MRPSQRRFSQQFIMDYPRSSPSESVSCSVVSDSDPMDCSLPGSSVQGILQAGILEWVAIPFSRAPSQPRDRTRVSRMVGKFFTA